MEFEKLLQIANDNYEHGKTLFADYEKLTKLCLLAKADEERWITLIENVKKRLKIEITDFSLKGNINPSFVAIFLTEEYKKPRPEGYQPSQLILKISVLAPVYMLYFDNFDSKNNMRIVITNPVTQREQEAFNVVEQEFIQRYPGYAKFDLSNIYHILPELGNISETNKRKPYL